MNLSLRYILEKIYDRSEMPQIKRPDISEVVYILKKKGISVTRELLDFDKLKDSQRQIYKDKVKDAIHKIKSGKPVGPTIISKDNYIVDGHHRAHAFGYLGKKVDCIKIGLDKDKAISVYSKISDYIENEKETLTTSVNKTGRPI